MLKIVSLFSFTFLLCINITHAQLIDTSFTFAVTDTDLEIPFTVTKGTKTLSMNVTGNLNSGSIKFIVINPNQKKMNGFDLVSDGNNSDYTYTGHASGISAKLAGKVQEKKDQKIKGKEKIKSSTSGVSASKPVIVSSGSNNDHTATVSIGNSEVGTSVNTSTSKSTSSNSNVSIATAKSNFKKWSGAKGMMSDVVIDPEPGTWVIKLDLNKAEGKYEILVSVSN